MFPFPTKYSLHHVSRLSNNTIYLGVLRCLQISKFSSDLSHCQLSRNIKYIVVNESVLIINSPFQDIINLLLDLLGLIYCDLLCVQICQYGEKIYKELCVIFSISTLILVSYSKYQYATPSSTTLSASGLIPRLIEITMNDKECYHLFF